MFWFDRKDERVTMMNALKDWERIAPKGKGWLKSAQLGAKTWDEKRHLRAIANASNGRIVSWQGSPGYKLFDNCLPEDFLRGDRATTSAIRNTEIRWNAILRRMHSRGIVSPALAEGTN